MITIICDVIGLNKDDKFKSFMRDKLNPYKPDFIDSIIVKDYEYSGNTDKFIVSIILGIDEDHTDEELNSFIENLKSILKGYLEENASIFHIKSTVKNYI